MRKLTLEEFIAKAKAVHGDKYGYSKVKYVNSRTKVCIVCPIHGEFLQNANRHLQGGGCPKCGGTTLLTQSEFISKASIVHNHKYDYSKVVYINNSTKVCIICPEHGEFWQKANGHLNGKGCLLCGRDSTINHRRTTQTRFIEKANEVHGFKYDYSKVQYRNNHEKVYIICPTHGGFWQEPNSHLQGYGCKKCMLESKITTLFGVATSDAMGESHSRPFKIWKSMVDRCYNTNNQSYKNYSHVSVCDEWLTYSNFKTWYNANYTQGCELDKDILAPNGSKIYSPDTCCFVPRKINILFRRCKISKYGRGITKMGQKYQVNVCSIGCIGTFATLKEASLAYKNAKEKYVKELADKYFKEGKINERVYNALLKYEAVD